MNFYFWLYKIVTPFYEKLQTICQAEITRRNRAEAIRLGTEAHKKFHSKEKVSLPGLLGDPRSENRTYSPDRCSHLKGGYLQAPYGKDYNVSLHTYPDSTSRIICNRCKKKWWKHLVTPQEWDEAMTMIKQSTNRPSSSEIPLKNQKDVE